MAPAAISPVAPPLVLFTLAYALDLVDVFGEDQAQATGAWAQHAAKHHRVGIGSLCGRNQPVEVAELVRIVAAVAEALPLHLLGRLGPVIVIFSAGRDSLTARQRLLDALAQLRRATM